MTNLVLENSTEDLRFFTCPDVTRLTLKDCKNNSLPSAPKLKELILIRCHHTYIPNLHTLEVLNVAGSNVTPLVNPRIKLKLFICNSETILHCIKADTILIFGNPDKKIIIPKHLKVRKLIVLNTRMLVLPTLNHLETLVLSCCENIEMEYCPNLTDVRVI